MSNWVRIFAASVFFVFAFAVVKAFAGNGRGAPVGPTTSGGISGGTGTCPSSSASTGSSSITGMLTQRNDLSRTGRNLNETTLNRSNIQSAFGLIGRLPVDGQVYAQPLVANSIPVVDASDTPTNKSLVFVATENDSVYAFDISNPTLLSTVPNQYQPFWHVNFVDACNASSGASTTGTCQHVDSVTRMARWKAMVRAKAQAAGTTVTDVQVNAPNISPTIGITATPVIDPATQTIYVTAMTDENGTIYWKLHALSLATGAEQPGSPVVISSSYSGQGYNNNGVTDSSNGSFTFTPINQLSRAGLVLNNGYVTVAFTSFDDNEPDHGWLFTYRAYSTCDSNSLQLAGVFVTTPNAGDGTIWQSGMAPAVDTDGSFIFATGNGDPAQKYAYSNPPDFADSVLRLDFTGAHYGTPASSFSVSDFFRPYNHAALATADVDLGSGGVLLLPQTELNSQVPLMVAGGKQGTIYLLNRANLGKDSASTSSDTNIVQELIGDIPGGKNYGPGIYGAPAYYNGKIYMGAAGDYLRSIPLVSGDGSCNLASGMGNMCLSWAGMQSSSVPIELRGASPVISASGTATSDAIVWYIDASAYTYGWTPGQNPPTETDGSAILYAFSTDDLTAPLYQSPITSVPTANLGATQNADDCADLKVGAAGCAVKFAVPTVQNGMVFVGTDSEVSVFGLLN